MKFIPGQKFNLKEGWVLVIKEVNDQFVIFTFEGDSHEFFHPLDVFPEYLKSFLDDSQTMCDHEYRLYEGFRLEKYWYCVKCNDEQECAV